MKKVLFFAAVLCLVATTAMAGDMTKRLGLGFVHWDAPVGGRYMFSEKVGLDVGLGLNVNGYDNGDGTTSNLTDWRVMVNVPINIHRVADRVNFNFLPGVEYYNNDNGDAGDADTYIDIMGALEFEVFVTPDFSVSASHGILISLYSPGDPNAENTTDISLFGNNVTEFGFHYYLPGGE